MGVCLSQQENLELVRDKAVVDVTKLPTTKEVVRFYEQRGIQQERAEQIARCFELKKDMVLEFQHGFQISISKEYKSSGRRI